MSASLTNPEFDRLFPEPLLRHAIQAPSQYDEPFRLLAAEILRLREGPPLWSIAIKECNDAHAALDRAKVPEQTEVPHRVSDGRHEITMGLAQRIQWLVANRPRS